LLKGKGFMLEAQEITKKLWSLVKDINPGLDDVGIQKIVDNLMDYGLFAIRLWLKQHPRHVETGLGKELGEESRKPP